MGSLKSRITSLLVKKVFSQCRKRPSLNALGRAYINMAAESMCVDLSNGVMQPGCGLRNVSTNMGLDASKCTPLVARGLHSSAYKCPFA